MRSKQAVRNARSAAALNMAELELKILVPFGEPYGEKSSSLNLEARYFDES